MKTCMFEKICQFILLCVYTLCPPFYMMTITYLMNSYHGGDRFIVSEIIPVFWGTIWIPALLGLSLNFIMRRWSAKYLQTGEKLKDYPLLFIFCYSIYFLILGKISWGSDCMYSGISGILVVFFVWLFRESVRKCVEYLPMGEKVYLYMIVFLFPVLILMVTDIVSIMETLNFYMTILLSPVIYMGGVSFFLMGCVVLRMWCRYYHIALKKNVYTLPQVILLLLIGDNLVFLYLVPYVGNVIIFISLIMSILLYTFELIYDYNRHRQLSKSK